MEDILHIEFLANLENEEYRFTIPRHLYDPQNPMEKYSDAIFFQHFRFTKDAFKNIINDVVPYFPLRSSDSRSAPNFMKLLYALQYLGTGNFFWNITQESNMSKATTWRYVQDGLEAMCCAQIVEKWIPWFTIDNARSMSSKFNAKYKLPRVIAAVDGTHCPILHPTQHEGAYINRKGWPSINVMLICDIDFVIRYVDASWPGSTHDARIMTESHVPNLMNNLSGFILLADSAYSCKVWCLTPYPSQIVLTQNQNRYQNRICAARVIIEQTIGILKNRCQILKRPFRSRLDKIGKIVTAACVMHNMARHYNQADVDNYGESNELHQPTYDYAENIGVANQVQDAYVRHYFS